jgi:hypothetical protein
MIVIRTSLATLMLALTVTVTACSGQVQTDAGRSKGSPAGPGGTSDPGAGGGAPGGPSPVGQTPPPAPGTVSAGVAPMRRLTAEQYRNTVRDLLGLPETPALALPGDDAVADRFLSNTTSAIKSVDLDRYADAAEALARKAVENLGTLVPCQGGAGAEAGCARSFIERFGRRAYRRPLGAEEIARLEKVHAAGGDFKAGIELVIAALLQSPKFLYLHEPVPGGASGVVAVDKYALGARLSYFILGTTPDDALLEAADRGQLASVEQVTAQADRLMNDARFGATLGNFHSQWLSLHEVGGADKDARLFPATVWNPAIRAALAEESRRFVEHVLREGDGRLETLLGAPYSMLSGPLYEYYGVPRPAGAAADAWQRAELPRAERAGLLTQGSLMAGQAHADRTSFILRGKLIREALLCTPIPPPPPDATGNEATVPATATARERAAAHREKPACASCHELFDPIGFAFENFDAAGRYRRTEADGKPIETAVEITATRTLNGPVTDGLELARKLGASEEVRECVARQWMRFALGREDSPEDRTSLASTARALGEGGGKVRDLLAALARSDAFRFQTVQP